MNILKRSAITAIAFGAFGAVGLASPALAAPVIVSGTFNCPANSNTPCKVSMAIPSDIYTDTISCQWTNPKVTLVQAAVVNGGSTTYAVAFALTTEERSARGMTRTDPPSIPVAGGQSLVLSFQATSSAANSVTCYVLGY